MLIYRKHAHQLLQNVVLGFAFSVVMIRLYLEIAPIEILLIGDFHVAHMLYGGVFLFVAALLVFTFQNSHILNISSWLTGIGFGFFIDEIGKYVSVTNDYYYKLAAPLIYLTFLVTVFILFWVKQKEKPTLTQKLHHALFDIQKILEQRFYLFEFPELKKTLTELRRDHQQPLHRELAQRLYEFVHGHQKKLVLVEENRLRRLNSQLRGQARQLLHRRVTKVLFLLVVLFRIIWVVPSILLPSLSLSTDVGLRPVRQSFIEAGLITGHREFYSFIFMVVMEVLVAVGLLLAFSLIVSRRRGGVWLARRLLFCSILFLGLFNIYFGQFSALISIAIDAGLLFILTKLYTTKV